MGMSTRPPDTSSPPSSTGATRATGAAAGQRPVPAPATRPDARPADQGAASATAARPLQEPGLRLQAAALDALPRRPLQPCSDGSYLPGLLGPRRRRPARPDLDLQADRRQTPRRLAVPRPLAVDARVDRRAACSACSRSSAARSGRPTASSSSSSSRWAVPGDRRPRVRRQHAGLHARVGELVQWDVMAMGSEYHTFHVHGHRWRDPDGCRVDTRPSARRSASRPLARAGPRHLALPLPRGAHMEDGMIGTYQVATSR